MEFAFTTWAIAFTFAAVGLGSLAHLMWIAARGNVLNWTIEPSVD